MHTNSAISLTVVEGSKEFGDVSGFLNSHAHKGLSVTFSFILFKASVSPPGRGK